MFLEELRAELENVTSISAKDRLVREFARTEPSPMINEDRATFFYVNKKARHVAIEGDWTSWQPADLSRFLPDTPLWVREEHFPRKARLEYRLVVNESRRTLDPCNPRGTLSEYGPHSVVVMPDYHAPREITDEGRIVPGTVKQHWITAQEYKERRIFWVCLPPRFDPRKKYPVAYFNNGDCYLHGLSHLLGDGPAVYCRPNQTRGQREGIRAQRSVRPLSYQ
jgi:hypothetical protein